MGGIPRLEDLRLRDATELLRTINLGRSHPTRSHLLARGLGPEKSIRSGIQIRICGINCSGGGFYFGEVGNEKCADRVWTSYTRDPVISSCSVL